MHLIALSPFWDHFLGGGEIILTKLSSVKLYLVPSSCMQIIKTQSLCSLTSRILSVGGLDSIKLDSLCLNREKSVHFIRMRRPFTVSFDVIRQDFPLAERIM